MSKHLISIHDFSKEEIINVLSLAAKFEESQTESFLKGKVVASLFFEPSTRTYNGLKKLYDFIITLLNKYFDTNNIVYFMKKKK